MKRLALRGAHRKFGDRSVRSSPFRARGIRTKDLVGVLSALRRPVGSSSSPRRDEVLELSARNLPRVEVLLADSLNVVDLVKADLVLIEQPALARMEEVYA
jgi:large subunit ribosomal protein L4